MFCKIIYISKQLKVVILNDLKLSSMLITKSKVACRRNKKTTSYNLLKNILKTCVCNFFTHFRTRYSISVPSVIYLKTPCNNTTIFYFSTYITLHTSNRLINYYTIYTFTFYLVRVNNYSHFSICFV